MAKIFAREVIIREAREKASLRVNQCSAAVRPAATIRASTITVVTAKT
jgi:hypothetical protein